MDIRHSSNAEASVMRIGSPLEIKSHNPDSRNMKADAPLPCFVPFGLPLIGTWSCEHCCLASTPAGDGRGPSDGGALLQISIDLQKQPES